MALFPKNSARACAFRSVSKPSLEGGILTKVRRFAGHSTAAALFFSSFPVYAEPPPPALPVIPDLAAPNVKDTEGVSIFDVHNRAGDSALFDNAKIERLSLQEAVEMALKNNLEAKVERTGVNIQRDQVQFAAGAFDPVFSMQVVHQSVLRNEDINNPSSAQAVEQQQQLQLQLNQAAIQLNADTINLQQQAVSQIQQNSALLQGQIAEINQIRALQGQPLITQDNLGNFNTSNLTPIQQQQLIQPDLHNIITLDQKNTEGSMSIQARTPYGTRYSFEARVNRFQNTYTGDPVPAQTLFQSFVGLTVQQPLLKGFGADANLADLRISALNRKIQGITWKQTVSTSVQGVMATYYDMLYALEEMHVRADAMAADSKLVTLYKRRLELGFSTPLEVQQSEVAVSTDQEAFLAAKNVFLEKQYDLKRLIISKCESDARVFIPESLPRLPVPKINRSEILSTAFEHRYDYQATLLGADVANVRLKFAKNQLLPELDLVATYGFNGLGQSFGGSYGEIRNGETPQWSAGISFQVPIGNRQPRAQYRAIAGQKEQAVLRIKQSEVTVGNDVDRVISRIETNQQRVESARKTREFAEAAVQITYRRLDEGLMSAFDVLEQQRKLFDAKSREIGTVSELNKSITQLWLVTGTVLQRRGIQVEDRVEKVAPNPLYISIKPQKTEDPKGR